MEGRSDWAEMIRAARAGEPAVRDALFGRYRAWLRVLAQTQLGKRLAGKFDASDIVQQALLEACEALPDFRGDTEGEFLAWLRSVLAHALAHEVRRYTGTEQRDVNREVSLELEESSLRLGSMLAAPDSSPSTRAAAHEEELCLAEVLGRLPEEYRAVIILRNLEGLSHEEVAERMGRSIGAVRMLWVRALARLRQELMGQ